MLLELRLVVKWYRDRKLMAVDTASKRFSMMDFDLPWAPGMIPPDGTVDAEDRTTFLWLYNGFALSGALTAAFTAALSFAGSVSKSSSKGVVGVVGFIGDTTKLTS